jgi:hypothetical protein
MSMISPSLSSSAFFLDCSPATSAAKARLSEKLGKALRHRGEGQRGNGHPLGFPKWEQAITRAPLSRRY